MSVLDLTKALEVVQAGLDEAEAAGVPSCVAVVDAGGNLLAFAAHPEAKLMTRELAINKAYTALSLQCSTDDLDDAVRPGGPFFGLADGLSRPIVTFAGGLPLGEPVVGAVGVSGGTLDDDRRIVRAAAEAW